MRLPHKSKARQSCQQRGMMLFCSIVIALCSGAVISTVQSGSVGDGKASAAPVEQLAVGKHADTKPSSETGVQGDLAKAATEEQASKQLAGEIVASAESRKGRSEAPHATDQTKVSADKSVAAGSAAQLAPEASKSTAAAAPSVTASSDKVAVKSAEPRQVAAKLPASTNNKQQHLSGKSGASSAVATTSSATGKKLPANLGTVTSTGSGGPAHYMSKHDAYSAIAEKHGALAQDAMRKSDKRPHHSNLQRFSGIQKASGFTDALNPFKSVTDGGLARTLGASMRSIMKGKYSIPAYVASAVLGAVALMAFYESPISPLPVPALPEPPVGRFPPEMPVISPNLQVPFRMNQQQGQQGGYGNAGQQQYGQQSGYQRSYQAAANPPQQQVLFPGATAQAAQQRQSSGPGPVQQLAANLISSVAPNRQTAQRKSGADQGAALSRSFFGSSNQLNLNNKPGAPANQAQQQVKQHGSSLLNFFGLGGSGSSSLQSAASTPTASSSSSAQSPLLGDVHRASGLPSAAQHESAAANILSNSHLINKMKSYFDRPVPHNSWSMDSNVPNHYDQYRRMSIIQALAKDTAFISSYFTPSRRSSNATSTLASPLKQSISNVFSAASSPSSSSVGASGNSQVASSRMQVDSVLVSPLSYNLQPQQQQQPIATNTKRTSTTGQGLMKAADRVAHALIDTFTSGLLHRSSEASSKKAVLEEQQQQQQQNALASATSLLSDIMSSYSAVTAANQQSQALNSDQASGHHQGQPQQLSGEQQPALISPQTAEQASARNDESPTPVAASNQVQQPAQTNAAEQQSIAQQPAKAPSAPEQTNVQPQQPLSRKVRSVGIDYPTVDLVQQQQQLLQPSKASQINNLVDFVSDSYKQNKLLFSFVMNQVGLSQALPYVEQFFGTPNEPKSQYN